MPTPAKIPQRALSRKEIEEIATKAARAEVQRLLGDESPTPTLADTLAFTHIPEAPVEPIPVVTRPIAIQYPISPDERRFVATIPTKDGIERQAGTRNMATGQVVLDNNLGAYGSWVAFLNTLHAQGQTPTKIEWDNEAQ